MVKTNPQGRNSNRNVDKFKKKNAQQIQAKTTTPSTEICKSVIINDQSVEKFAIKEESLLELRKTLEGQKPVEIISNPSKSFAVKIKKPVEEKKVQHEKTQKYLVAKVAPPDAQLKPVDTAPSGPRYTNDGEIIAHSILGSVQDFVSEAIRRDEMKPDSPAAFASFAEFEQLDVKKYERPKPPHKEYIPTAFNQEKALKNWRKKMLQRKKIQGYVSNLLEKPIDKLVMSQSLNSYREVKETSTVLERAIHAVDHGMEEGRSGCEFWKRTTVIGDPVEGLRTTLTASQKGISTDIEHIRKSQKMQIETGEIDEFEEATVNMNKSWFDNQYLKKRIKELSFVLDEIDPYQPDIESLEVVNSIKKEKPVPTPNTNPTLPHLPINSSYTPTQKSVKIDDPLSAYPDVVTQPMIGPSIVFNGIPAYWNDSSDCNQGQIGAVTRVGFECGAGGRTSSEIVIKNNGTTAIFYEWRKVPHVSTLEALELSKTQRFYFNTNDGHILPGDIITIPFVFKSNRPGIYTETWDFLTTPAVIGGASLCVVLKGVALLDDTKVVAQRQIIEENLAKKEKEAEVKHAVEEIIRGIITPERSPSPLDMYITEKEMFAQRNPKRFYDFQSVERLKEIYSETLPPNLNQQYEWDFSLVGLLACVTTVPDEKKRNELMNEMNEIINFLSLPFQYPNTNQLYAIAYKHWIQYVDNLISCSMSCRASMELPEEVMTETITPAEIRTSARSQRPQTAALSSPMSTPDDKKNKGKKAVVKEAKEEKVKKGKSGTAKDAKDALPRPKSNQKLRLSPKGDEDWKRRKPNPKLVPFVPAPDPLEPEVRQKYSEKIYGLAYNLMVEMIDNVTAAFEDVKATRS